MWVVFEELNKLVFFVLGPVGDGCHLEDQAQTITWHSHLRQRQFQIVLILDHVDELPEVVLLNLAFGALVIVEVRLVIGVQGFKRR